MPSTVSQPRRHQTYTRDSDSKVFTVRTVHRSRRAVILTANTDGAAFEVSYNDLRNNYTAS